jgi:HEAT repeat protein
MNRGFRHSPIISLTLLAACLAGCSRKPAANTAAPADKPTGPVTVSALSNSPPAPSPAAEIAQALKTTGNKEAAWAAIREYAGKNPSAFAELAALLRSGDADLALLGAYGLSGIATPEAAAEVLAAIQGSQLGMSKRELAAALSDFNNPQLAGLFLGLLGTSQEREVFFAAQRALANLADTPLVNQVVQRCEASNSAAERDNLVGALRLMQNTNCVEGLLSIFRQQRVISSTDPLGLAAADTLGIIGSQVAVTNLFVHLWSLREGASSPVFDSLGRVSNPESLPLLASVAYGQAHGASLYSRMAAVQALGNYNAQQVQPALNWLIQNDSNAGIREAAANALKRVTGQ